jgi:hypothetical protein
MTATVETPGQGVLQVSLRFVGSLTLRVTVRYGRGHWTKVPYHPARA